jgi:uncharacterized protein with HEPN domain
LRSNACRPTWTGVAALPPEQDPADCLAAILDNIAEIEDYTAGLERGAFEQDGLTRDAVERCIERVCTAVSRLGECTPALMTDQSWGNLVGVGDQLRGSCRPIDADIIWATAERDLQALKLSAALTLDRLKSEAGDG